MSNTLKSLEELTGLKRITKKILLNLCKKNHLYQTPRLNDVLYLHYQGFRDIEELDEYTGLKCLWLECNAISEIKNLTNQPLLKCLFLQNNLVRKIENLNDCPELDTINLSHNHIANIENCGIEVLPVLTNLNLANNYIRTYDGLKGLLECKMLSVLDLSNNRIEDVLVVKIFSNMPELRVLILQGNPVVGLIPQYRKTLILECDNLTYLDSRPVFAKDRACAEAWKRGGYEEEKAEHERWIKEDQRRIRENVNSLIRLRNSYKNGKQQEVKLLTSDDENAKTDSDTSSGSSSDTESSKSSLEKENSIKDNESGTDNELNKINDDKSIKDISENDNENSENFVVTSTALNNNLGKEDISKEEIEPNHLLIKKRKKESERTFRKCKEHKKSNDRIWPKKYLLCEEPESILASANIFEETLDLKLEIEPSTTIVEQILNKIISDIEISQALNKNPKLDLKENMSRKLAEQNQNKNLEIEGVLEEKYFNDLIYDLKLPIVLEEQKQDEITQLEENEEFTPKEFNDMMDILKQNQNEEFATDDVTSTVGLNNISDTELEVTSSAVLSDQNSNGILITEKNENFMESLDLLESSQNDISDTKEIKKLNVSEGLEECLEKSCTLKQTETNEANEIEEQKELEQTHVLSEEVENKTPKMEESQLTNELKKLTEMLDLLKQKRNESYETEKSQKSKKSQPEENLDLGFEDKSSLMISNKTETTGDFKEMLDETQENQSKQVLEVDKKSEKKPKEILCILEENNKEFLEFIGSEEIKKPINLNVQENLSSMLSDQYENVPSETDEFEEFKETKEQFSSDDENFKTSSDCGGSNVDSDSQTDNENEAETEYNYNANDQSLKEMTENLDKIEKDLNEVNFDEQFHEEIGFSKHMRVARSELNRRKCKAQKLSNDRNWLRKYLLQEEPEEVLATAITYHKTLIDFQLTWNPSESEENQIEPQKRIVDKNFDDAVNVNLEFQSCSSFLEELQKEISEANFANEHENLEENSCDVKSEQNQSITTLQNEE